MENFLEESPTDSYMIYDQFHWLSPNHFQEEVKGRDQALIRYTFHKVFHPECNLAVSTIEAYYRKVQSLFG